MLLKRSLIVVSIFLCAVSLGNAQDTQGSQAADSPSEEPLTENQQALLTEEEQKKAQALESEVLAKAAEEKAAEEKAAEEKAAEEKAAEEKAAEEKAEQKRLEEISKAAKPPKEVFKPTEEISEDLPVPFPVDI